MDSRTIVIIGGVAGGAGAAAKARRTNEQADIILFERGPYVSFANCGLPYYVAEEIKKKDALLLQNPESFWKRFRVRAYVRHEVLRIDRTNKQVAVKDLATEKTFFQKYDTLVLAPGAGAIVPPLPGLPARNVFKVKTVPDSEAIRHWILQEKPGTAVIVGAGFIGLEAAEALKRRGLKITIVEKMPQVLPALDPDMAGFVAMHLEGEGIELILGDGIKELRGAPVHEIILESGRVVPADMVILSIGVRPELKLARDCGLEIGSAGGIQVNDRQQTSDPYIYAAGDAVETIQLVTGRKTRIPLAGPANKQGRVAGANAAGGNLTFPGAVGTAIVESLGVTAAKTGLSENEAAREHIPYYVSFTHSLHHAGYYPGGALMHVKLIVEKDTGRLLGAQVVGEDGVDKRIDVIATALYARLKVTDLENLDLAYAPQFSSAKDPIIMAGFVAANVSRSEIGAITCKQLSDRIENKETLQIVDVRTPEEYAEGHLAGSLHIPIDELRDRIHELDPQHETVVYCRVGFRGYLAALILQHNGFERVLNLSGGILVCPENAVVA